MLAEISEVQSPVAQYLSRYARPGRSYLWDELAAAAWLDPTLIKKETERLLYMDVNLDRGAGYGDVLIWPEAIKPALDLQLVHAQMDVDAKRFHQFFVNQMTRPTPNAKNPLMLKPSAPPSKP